MEHLTRGCDGRKMDLGQNLRDQTWEYPRRNSQVYETNQINEYFHLSLMQINFKCVVFALPHCREADTSKRL